MTSKLKDMLSRISAQFLKTTLALIATLAVGGAWAGYIGDTGTVTHETLDASLATTEGIWIGNNDWLIWESSQTSDGFKTNGLVATYLELAGWDGASAKLQINSGFYRANTGDLTVGGKDVQAYFTLNGGRVETAYWMVTSTGAWNADTSSHVGNGGVSTIVVNDGELIIGYRYNDTTKQYELSNNGVIDLARASSNKSYFLQRGGIVSSQGVENGNALVIANGASSEAVYTISNGTYTARANTKIVLGNGDGSKGTLNIHGGTVNAANVSKGAGAGSVSFDGGTLVSSAAGTLIGSGIAVSIGANGGTIDVGANAVTNAAPVSGTGTITVKGTGSLTFTGDMSGFCGAVVVETSGCTVTLPASATKAVPGANTSASNGVYSYSANTTHHDWWTGDSSTDWATAGNWGRFLIDEGTTGYDINEWNDNTINFASVVNISKPLTITENDPDKSYNVEFTASSASDGLVSTDVLNVGTSNEGMATFTSGTYSFNNMYVGGSGATGSVTVNGASLTITTGDPQIGNGGTGTFTLSSGFVSFGYAGSAKWAFLKGGTINLDGGEMAVCRLNCDTAPAVINFNGGTLTSYNDGYSKDNIIENDANWTLNVKAGGAKFNIPSGLETTVNQALVEDAQSTGGGLTKLGDGTLVLAALPTFTGNVVLKAGAIKLPSTFDSSKVTTDVEGKQVAFVTADGVTIYTLAKEPGTCAWTGATSTSWSDTGNWEGGAIPTAVDTASFPAGASVALAGDAAVAASITAAGDLTITGYGDITVSGDVDVSGTITFTPAEATSTIVNAHEAYTIKLAATGDLTASAIAGGATVQASNVTCSNTSTFYGSITGGSSFTKTGDGIVTLQGPNTFTGDIAINSGTLKLGNYLDGASYTFGFDSSDTNKWTIEDDNGNKYVTTLSGHGYNFSKHSSATESIQLVTSSDYFDGQTVMKFSPGVAYYTESSSKVRPNMTFAVYQENDDIGTDSNKKGAGTPQVLFSDHQNGNNQVRFGYELYYGGGVYNQKRYVWYGWGDGNSGAPDRGWMVYVDGKNNESSRIYVIGKKSIVSTVDSVPNSSNRGICIGHTGGNAYSGAVAEIIGLNDTATLEKRAAVEAALMQKWRLTDALSHQMLPSTADVTMSAGSVLDLGGFTQTIASLSGSGTVQNGKLNVTSAISVGAGDTLVIPSASTYTLAAGMIATVDADAGTATITKAPASITVSDVTTYYPTVQAAVDAAALAAAGEGKMINVLQNFNENIVISATGIVINMSTFTNAGSVTGVQGTTDVIWNDESKTWVSIENTPFQWTGAIDNNWTRDGNWNKSGYPGTADDVVFPASDEPWSVALGDDITVSTVAFNGNVVISGGVLFVTSAPTGSGTITLGENGGFGNNGTEFTLANNVIIAGGETTTKLYSKNARFTVSGGLSGEGRLELVAYNDQDGIILKGANTMTAGSITVNAALNGSHRNCSAVRPAATNARIAWTVSNGTASNNSSQFNWFNGSEQGTYYFGSVGNSSINQPGGLKNSILEIGALNSPNDMLSGWMVVSSVTDRHWNSTYTSTTVKKVGTGKLGVAMNSVYNYEIKGGSLELLVDNARPAPTGTIAFTGEGALALNDAFTYDVSTNIAAVTASTPYPITVDTGTTPRTWEVAIPNNYTGGFTKKGTGTLTLSQPPAYTGTTTVEGGVLYIVEGYSPTLAAGTVEMVSDKTGYKKYVPAAAAVAHVGNLYYPTFAEAWAAAGNGDNAARIYLDAAPAQDDVVTLTEAWQRVRVANGTYSADGHIAISGSLANVALKTSVGADMTEYTAYPTVAVTVTPGTGVASGVIADGYISKSGDDYTVYSGDTVTIVWTAEEGYVFEGGATTATTTVTPTEDVTPVCPTVSAIPSVSVSSVSATYGVDFTNATVTATLTGATAGQSYTMTVGGKSYTGEATAGGTVTFNDVAVTHSQADDTFTYEITSNDASVSGGNGSKAIADSASWFSTGADGSTEQTSGGSWEKSMTWTDGKTTFDEDGNTFTATDASSASKVEVKMSVCFGNANDEAINLGNANAAVKVATVNNALVFQALNNGEFVTLNGLTPTAEATYEVVLCFDYTTHKYTVTIGDTPLTYNESTELVMSSESTGIQSVAFKGVGSLASLAGTQIEGCVAMDAAGTRYLTLEAAMEAAANDSAKLPLTVLHDGTYNGETYAKGATGVPSGASIVAADQTTADAAAAKMSIALTSAQVQQGLKTAYYKAVAKEKTSGTYEVSFELADAVKPTVADEESTKAMETTTSAVALHVTNTKVGLYYGIAAGTSTTLGVDDAATLTKCTADGQDLGLTATLPESGVKYYKVIVSDSAPSSN